MKVCQWVSSSQLAIKLLFSSFLLQSTICYFELLFEISKLVWLTSPHHLITPFGTWGSTSAQSWTKHLLLAPRTQLLWLHFIISSWASSYDCWYCHDGRWSHYCDIMPNIISVSIANSVRSIRQSIVWWLCDHKSDQSILTEQGDHHLPSLTQVLIAFKTFQTNCEAGQ